MESFNKFLNREKLNIGIDIGSYAVKAAALYKDNLKLKKVAFTRVEHIGSKESLVKAIKETASKISTLNKEVNIAVSGPSVIVRFIELPRMTENELHNAITFEAEKYIPFNIDDVIIGHHLLIPRLGDETKMLVLAVAARRDLINERLSLLDQAGLSVGVLDVAALANFNAFVAASKRKKDEVVALVDIGARATEISVIDGETLHFTRSIQLGGNDITKALSDSLSIDLKGAENMKMKPAKKAAEVNEKTEGILHNIIEEIRLSFSYYENQSGKSVQRVYLTGGSSKITNLRNMFKENIGIEASSWDATECLELDPSIDSQQVASVKDHLGVAIGLALR
jgi:type IV pilus assembly protein PilM